jgi:hypothetical protein
MAPGRITGLSPVITPGPIIIGHIPMPYRRRSRSASALDRGGGDQSSRRVGIDGHVEFLSGADARLLPQAPAILKSRFIHGAFTSPNLI